MWHYPLTFLPLLIPLCSPFLVPFNYLEPSLLGQDPSQVACKLTSPSLILPTLSPFQIPSTQVIYTPHYDDFKTPASPVRNTNRHPLAH
jgi:hypothetical protein